MDAMALETGPACAISPSSSEPWVSGQAPEKTASSAGNQRPVDGRHSEVHLVEGRTLRDLALLQVENEPQRLTVEAFVAGRSQDFDQVLENRASTNLVTRRLSSRNRCEARRTMRPAA